MANTQIVFVKTQDDVDDLEARYTVEEQMDLGEMGFAAVVSLEGDEELHELNYMAVENYDEDISVELQVADEAISTNINDHATLTDVRNLHDAPAGSGDGTGITWVVMDSGIDPHHPIFESGQIKERHNMTDAGSNDAVGHGTACAGQIARLAPNVSLIDLRIFGTEGRTSLRTITRAYSWLINHTDRYDGVNMSWGASKKVRRIDQIHTKLVEKGVRDVIAAGNSGGPGGSPATADEAFSAGSCDKTGRMSSYSSSNPNYDNPNVTTIGEHVRLARAQGTSMGHVLGDDWVVASGTSFSAPHQSGFCANYLSANPNASPADVKSAFGESAKDIEGTERDGAGLSQYQAALSIKSGEEVETAGATVWSFAGRDSLYVSEDWLEDGKYTVSKEQFLEAFEKQ